MFKDIFPRCHFELADFVNTGLLFKPLKELTYVVVFQIMFAIMIF